MSQFSEGDLERIVEETLAAQRDVPAEWREAARAAYAWRGVDQELLELTYDSQRDAALAVRGAEGARTLEFVSERLTLEVELTGDRVLGRLGGPVTGQVTLEGSDGSTRTVETDPSGFFSLDRPESGTVRLAVRSGDVRLVTPWIVL